MEDKEIVIAKIITLLKSILENKEIVKAKINALLHAQTGENTYLAYLLLQSQLKYTSLEALNYIFQFQIEQIWTPKMGFYKFEFGNYKIIFSSDEEMTTDYTVDIYHLTVYIEIYPIENQQYILRKEEFVSDYIGKDQILIQEYIAEYQACILKILTKFEKLLH